MIKEIIVNAGELESRVAIIENGRLMELHVEREPKIVGNIYKGRVTKVLKGMDAAFVDIGIERNAFLAASDVISADDEDGGSGHSHGRLIRGNIPSITTLLHNNQEVLAQVVRAPMGTKGARITTRLSIPGRYMVLMLNSGAYVGVSRKIEDTKERQRLRTIANELRPETYSLIVRTEAEGKSEEELQQDVIFLHDMAKRIERKANSSTTPSLVHGDLTLIFRLIRDAFTRDVNRLVVDSPFTYENVLEMVGIVAPRMKNRVFLYNDPMPIFHAYNIEPEIERTLRRKVWLPSGGSLIVDQAEALTAIDVNTGRFVGSVELAETVLTTNLQAADEAARQLRLRDLGGIIVVDFIDMDNAKHRQQVITAFEEALRRDRAKIKVHNISSLGLVEMTRKRTGESLVSLLTEPCPYCSGIGRVQNSLTMALRIERELAANTVEHPETEAILLTAHSRVIASMLGYEGEAQQDLEAYLGRPVYLRIEDQFHPNAYRMERLTLEQALAAVKHLEEGDVVEAQVMNPDPEVSLSPLVQANGIYIIVPDLDAPVGAHVKVRIKTTNTSLSVAEPLAEEQRGIRIDEVPLGLTRPSLVPESILPAYLREERALIPPAGLQLLSPTAESEYLPGDAEEIIPEAVEVLLDQASVTRRRRKNRQRKRGQPLLVETPSDETPVSDQESVSFDATQLNETVADQEDITAMSEPDSEELTSETPISASARRRRRRRKNKRLVTPPVGESVVDTLPETVSAEIPRIHLEYAEESTVTGQLTESVVEVALPAPIEVTPTEEHERPARRRRNRRREHKEVIVETSTIDISPAEPIRETITPAEAAQAMLDMLEAIPGKTEIPTDFAQLNNTEILAAPLTLEIPPAVAELTTADAKTPEPRKPRRNSATHRRPAKKATTVDTIAVQPKVAQTSVEQPPAIPVIDAPKTGKRRVNKPKNLPPAATIAEEIAPIPAVIETPMFTSPNVTDSSNSTTATKPRRSRKKPAPKPKVANEVASSANEDTQLPQ